MWMVLLRELRDSKETFEFELELGSQSWRDDGFESRSVV